MPTSYTTSWDLTIVDESARVDLASAHANRDPSTSPCPERLGCEHCADALAARAEEIVVA